VERDAVSIARSALLWASRNQRIERIVRSSRAMRPLVSRFMPGESMDDALAAVRKLQSEGTPTILTYLGENVASHADADETVAEYERLFAALRSARADTHVSIKLTQFGWDFDRQGALERVRTLSRIAVANGTMLAIDMESSSYVESTVEAYEALARESGSVALCLQAYLHRTPADLQRLLAVTPYIRLVKGAYREPAAVAIQTREEISSRYRALARTLLEQTAAGTRIGLGTHDLSLISDIRNDARDLGVKESAFEVQMLYGIQDAARRQLGRDGVRTRVLISYGRAWYPWFMRRLAEKPSNLVLMTRNLLS
jgi:proline dehydrogenase